MFYINHSIVKKYTVCTIYEKTMEIRNKTLVDKTPPPLPTTTSSPPPRGGSGGGPGYIITKAGKGRSWMHNPR